MNPSEVRPPKRNEECTPQRIQELYNAGWRFRQKTLYSHGLPGDIPIFHKAIGWPMWASKKR